jgi:hypothetical protein
MESLLLFNQLQHEFMVFESLVTFESFCPYAHIFISPLYLLFNILF